MIREYEQPFFSGDAFSHSMGCFLGTTFLDIGYSQAYKWLGWKNTESTEILSALTMYGFATWYEINQRGNYYSFKDNYWNIAGVTLGFVVQRYVWDGNVYLSDEQKLQKRLARQERKFERKK